MTTTSTDRPPSVLSTELGRLTRADATAFLASLPARDVRLVVTSPWFTGPFTADSADPVSPRFTEWITGFLREIERVLLPDGSVVLEMGCTWAEDAPVRTAQNLAAIAALLASGTWKLLQEFYWYNPDFLLAKDEWVEERGIRLRDCVTTWFWLARTPDVPVDNRRVRGFQSHLTHPFGNFLAFGDADVDQAYLDRCRAEGTRPSEDRFPVAAPAYFIRLLTEPGEHVVDPFVGIGSTALAAELSGRRWSCNDFSAEAVEVARRRLLAARSAGGGGPATPDGPTTTAPPAP
ncbi:DNA modification methylase [Streptoalloteichus tenebrarius]|uniref:Methyltransferase n=2 Tax=Actinomycetes TaxID=1760 RepID=C5HYQ6_9ACTN|nr:DNA methyltransferase [Streptoalloteichus tenebrarius]ACR82895.1 AmgB [Streptomyces sp. KCTC 9047]MCP2258277.1 DNA modification methylase [Streptoalloteichus tenebrarius]BFF04492.1 hypothetical protein GCM10020241_61670 [Streptoalloteichus tenebrarius]